jgi:zinc/manganese transport system permease protein
VELSHLLFGSVLGVDDPALFMMAGVASLTWWRWPSPGGRWSWNASTPPSPQAAGVRGGVWHLLFLGLVVLNLVLAAFQALGTPDGGGLMMLPAIAARHWSRDVGGLMMAAVGLALVATVLGLLVSYHADLPSGPAIVLAASGLWVISLIAGPVDGLLARHRKQPHLEG